MSNITTTPEKKSKKRKQMSAKEAWALVYRRYEEEERQERRRLEEGSDYVSSESEDENTSTSSSESSEERIDTSPELIKASKMRKKSSKKKIKKCAGGSSDNNSNSIGASPELIKTSKLTKKSSKRKIGKIQKFSEDSSDDHSIPTTASPELIKTSKLTKKSSKRKIKKVQKFSEDSSDDHSIPIQASPKLMKPSRKPKKTLNKRKIKKTVNFSEGSSEEAENPKTKFRRLAERAAECDYKGVPSKIKKKKKKIKQKYRHYSQHNVSLLKKRKDKKKIQKFDDLMVQHLGDKNAVVMFYESSRRIYIYKCPECGESIREKLWRHLVTNHNREKDEADMLQSKMRILYLWCKADKHNTSHPGPCNDCNEWHLRIDHHFKNKSKHPELKDDSEIKKRIFEAKNANRIFQTKLLRQSLVNCDDKHQQRKPLPNESIEPDDMETEFVYRSKPDTINSVGDIDYLPEGAQKLTKAHRKLYNISQDDFFTIYYEDAETLLQAFYDSRVSAGDTHENALQHRNKVETIWSAMNPEMTLFPLNALSNLHLFRDFYHTPNFKKIGKSGGVQAGTLRSRYTSLTFFISFLRKQQIFAGLTRNHLRNLEKAIEDFNKELNPHIKQRTIDVRRNKLRHLLTPSHFIAYGRSEFVQDLLKPFFDFKKSKKIDKEFVTKHYSIRFHDYVMAAITIGNGLRASNLIELKVKDVEEAAVDDDYPGHRIITNSTYKTSTIYGEKFIVVPVQLFDQILFYLKFLRPILVIGKRSSYLFVPSSDSTAKCNQSNISAKLTSTFGLANVFKKDDYTRVSCTRIRCAIATFACNEGGFETAFFARNFMKNREETTSKHYNLLSNRRHAINIAMKLYENFTDANGEEIPIEETDLNELTMIFRDGRMPEKKEILNWVKSNNIDLSQKEIADLNDMYPDQDDVRQFSISSFYGSEKKTSTKKKLMKSGKIDFNVGCDPDDVEKVKSGRSKTSFYNAEKEWKIFENRNGKTSEENQQKDKNEIEERNQAEKQECMNEQSEENKQKAKNEIEEKNQAEEEKCMNEAEENEQMDNNEIEERNQAEEEKSINEREDARKEFYADQNKQNEELCKRTYPKRRRNPQTGIAPQETARISCVSSDPVSGFLKKFIDDKIGFGIFTSEDFEERSFLLTYRGNLIDSREADELESHYEDIGAGCYLYFFRHGKQTLCVDATLTDCLCKFVNDCPRAQSNCSMEVVLNDDTPYLCLFATKFIPAGTELRYDYGDSRKKMWWRNNEKYNKPLLLQEVQKESVKELELIQDSPKCSTSPPIIESSASKIDESVVQLSYPSEVSDNESLHSYWSNNESDCESSDASVKKKGKRKTIKTRKKSNRFFNEDEVEIIRSKCQHIIGGMPATKVNIERALQRTSILGKYDWKKVRSRIAYERR